VNARALFCQGDETKNNYSLSSLPPFLLSSKDQVINDLKIVAQNSGENPNDLCRMMVRFVQSILPTQEDLLQKSVRVLVEGARMTR
jgi:hypothetical protein